MKVEFKKINPLASIPKHETAGAAGFDFVTMEDIEIPAGEIKLIPTGLVIKTPASHMLLIAPRSSMPKKTGLRMPHSIGIIDSDYCGPEDEVKIQIHNPSSVTIKIEKGQKIAQGVFVPVDQAEFVEIEELNAVTRGGWGSTS